MIRLSKMADYAIVIATAIAHHRDVLHSAQTLASQSQLALPTVSKILKQLVKAELLTSVRGSQGGYQLAKAAELITIAAIIEAMDGPIALTECVDAHANQRCSIEAVCGMKTGWDKVNDAVRYALSRVTLADFADEHYLPNFALDLPKHISDLPVVNNHPPSEKSKQRLSV